MSKFYKFNFLSGFENVIYSINMSLIQKSSWENASFRRFYDKLLISIDFKKQSHYQAILSDFHNNIFSNLNIGWKGNVGGVLLPFNINEENNFEIYDQNGFVEKILSIDLASNYISDQYIYKLDNLQNWEIFNINKFDYSGTLKWSFPHINKLKDNGPSILRFDDENFLFYDITEVGEHNVYTKAWLVCISNQTGQLKWKHEIEGLLAIDFLYCKDKVIVRTKTTIQCYHVDNGALVWEYEIDLEEREAFLKKWSEKVSEHWLLYNGTYKFNFTIGQNDILHVLTFQKYVQIDVHTGKILNDFEYATQVAKFKFRFNASPIGNIVKVSTTHVIASVKHMAVFINMKTGLIDHQIEGEDKNGGTIMDIIIPSDNVLVLSETCATKRFPNTIVKVYESE